MSNPDKHPALSIVLPARNEADGLRRVLPALQQQHPDAEIVVVDDGSVDETVSVATEHGARVIKHAYGKGNGAAIKTGARAAKGQVIVFMDADTQHSPEHVSQLLQQLSSGYDMVVGARTSGSQAGMHRAIANRLYNRLASWMVGQPIPDLTSGFRAVSAAKFRKFLHLLPNGFSYPTTITMSFFRAGYSVAYVPIVSPRRIGRSHVRILRDGIRFLLIIFKIGTLYSPLKIFLPISLSFFLTGAGYYAFTYLTSQRFTNMSALLLVTAVLVFLIGLVSEQITALHYRDTDQ
jgi:glycosyltransferase involved in cell wall biosynthesis